MSATINHRYRIISKLGQGGMGIVYLVKDPLRSDQVMALKLVRTEHIGDRSMAQFKYEFATLGQLHHPNLVEVYDFGSIFNVEELPDAEHLNAFYYTMQYVQGEDLLSLAQRHLKVPEAGQAPDYTWLYEIIVQVCRALSYIHSRGLIHYDVKSRNIQITPSGQVKLMDFGLIGEPRAGGQIKVRGTPDYIAPEMIRGGEVDQRADLYSLGVTLYEIVTGRLPFGDTSSIVLMRRHLEEQPELPSDLVRHVPQGLQDLIMKLLEKEPANRYASASQVIEAINVISGLQFPVETRETRRGYIQSARFVGREAELAHLQGLLMHMLQGQGNLVLITGAAGMGKRRLGREFKARAQVQRVLVCEGDCQKQDRIPYRPWMDIFSMLIPLIRTHQPKALAQHGPALNALMPELGAQFNLVATQAGEKDPAWLRNSAADLLLAVNQPLVIILEDLQYADAESIALLEALSQKAGTRRLLLVGSYRDDEITASHPLLGLIDEATGRADEIQASPARIGNLISLLPLNEADVEVFVRSMLGAEEIASAPLPDGLLPRLMAETGGNPTFIQSVMQSLVEEELLRFDSSQWQIDLDALTLPADIQDAARRHLKRLDATLLGLLQWAAAMGEWLEIDVLLEVCGRAGDTAMGLVQRAVSQHVLEVSQRGGVQVYGFTTDAMRQVVYQTLTEPDRRERHQRIIEALRRLYPLEKIVDWLAWHAVRVGDTQQSLQVLRQAAESAMRRQAIQTALRYYTEAITLLESHPELVEPALSFDLHAGRERCYVALGEREQQQKELAVMSDLAQALGDLPRQVEALRRKVELAGLRGQKEEALRSAEAAVELAHRSGQQLLEAQALTGLGDLYYQLSRFDHAQSCHEQALKLYETLNDPAGQAENWRLLGHLHMRAGRTEPAIQYAQRALKLFRQIGDLGGQAKALTSIGLAVTDFAQARDHHEQSLAIRRSLDDKNGQAVSYNNLAVIHWSMGLYSRALEYMEQAVGLARSLQDYRRLGLYMETMGRCCLALGRYEEALAVLEESIQLTQDSGNRWAESAASITKGQVLLAQGLPGAALEVTWRAGNILRELKATELSAALAWRAAAHLQLGQWELAYDISGEATRLASALGTGGDYPMQDVWWIHYQVLEACPAACERIENEAWDSLQQAHLAMLNGIATLSDEALRRSYLNKVQINRAILLEWTRQMARRTGAQHADFSEAPEIEQTEAVEPARIQDKLRRVLNISVQMNETHDAESLLHYVMDQVIELSGAERGFLVLVDEAGQMNLRVARGMAEDELARAQAEISYTVLGEVAQSKKPVLLQDAMADERFSRQSSVLELNLRSVLCVPLLTRAELVGMIYADNRTVSGRFSQEDMELMVIFANQAASAIENARLYEELEAWTHTLEQRVAERTAELEAANQVLSRRAVQLEASSQVGQQATSILALDELLDQVVRLIHERFGYYNVSVWLIAPTRKTIILQASAGRAQVPLSRSYTVLDFEASSIIAHVCRTSQYRLVNDVRAEPDYLSVKELPETRSELTLPLRMGSRSIGVLDIQAEQIDAFGPDDLWTMQILADQIAIAIRNAQLYQAETDRRNLADALRQAGREMSSSLELGELTGRVLDQMAMVLPYERGSLWLQEDRVLVSVSQRGFPEGEEDLRMPIRPGDVYNQMVERQGALVVDDVTREAGWKQAEGLPLNYSWLGVPLISKGRTLGMISLTRCEAGAFMEYDATVATTFAVQAAAALENASLYDQIKRFNEQLEQMVMQRTEELNRAYHNLERLDRNKSDFINVAAHELRTPLTITSGYAQVAQTHPTVAANPEIKKLVDGIVSGSNRMLEVVNSMLDISKITSQTFTLYKGLIPLVFVIDAVGEKYQRAMKERQISFEMVGLEELPPVQADADQLTKVFGQLIVNAIKFTPDGGKITVSGKLLPPKRAGQPERVELVVTDNGIGIDPAYHELIFEKFYQTGEVSFHSSGQTKFKGGGPGLGLAIARGIIEAHGGRIWVESPGHDEETCPGSSFHIILYV